MGTKTPIDSGGSEAPKVTQQGLERVLAVGRLLLSVLTPEQLDELREELAAGKSHSGDASRTGREIGNAGVS